MKRILTVLGVLVLGLLGGVGAASAQVLWKGAEYGMSMTQAQQAVPEAKPVANGSELYGGVREQLRVEGIKIADQNFVARLYFLKERLRQVTVSLVDVVTAEEAEKVFSQVVETLRAEHGAESTIEEQKGFLLMRDYDWALGRTNISALLMIGEGAEPVINVNYQLKALSEPEQDL